jgi:protein-S-isoprenylcysteine O-methyltransferase Ste14
MRDVFVGILCAVGVFMVSYKGYERKDALAGNLACIFAVGVALFPTAPDNPSSYEKMIAVIHALFASLFFLTISYFSLFLFTKTDPSKTTTRKKRQRNTVYRICGYTMLTAIALILVYSIAPDSAVAGLKKFHPVFWFESIAVEAFGIAWMTKGEAILKDEI